MSAMTKTPRAITEPRGHDPPKPTTFVGKVRHAWSTWRWNEKKKKARKDYEDVLVGHAPLSSMLVTLDELDKNGTLTSMNATFAAEAFLRLVQKDLVENRDPLCRNAFMLATAFCAYANEPQLRIFSRRITIEAKQDFVPYNLYERLQEKTGCNFSEKEQFNIHDRAVREDAGHIEHVTSNGSTRSLAVRALGLFPTLQAKFKVDDRIIGHRPPTALES